MHLNMKKKKTISVVGCGWLGLPLAKKFVENGFIVKGSTTTSSKLDSIRSCGIEPHLFKLNPNEDSFDMGLFDAEVLIVNIPPSRKIDNIQEYYPEQIATVLSLAKKGTIDYILFVSSTSVYPDKNRAMSETDTDPSNTKKAGKAILEAEKVLSDQFGLNLTILRLCGLYGPNRHPGRFLAAKKLNSHPRDRVNMIHQADCVNIILRIVLDNIWGETLNACSGIHPEKESFYHLATKSLGLIPPQFNSEAHPSTRTIDSSKLKRLISYDMIYPNPIEWIKKK